MESRGKEKRVKTFQKCASHFLNTPRPGMAGERVAEQDSEREREDEKDRKKENEKGGRKMDRGRWRVN